MDKISVDSSVLIIGNKNDQFEALNTKIKEKSDYVSTTNVLNQGNSNSYDVVIINAERLPDNTFDDLLKKSLLLLKQGGNVIIVNNKFENIEFRLKVNGFVNVESQSKEIIAYKPKYASGSAQKINLNNTVNKAADVWKLDDTIDDDIETIDPDNLLDDDDLKKPDPSSLKVCGTTGQRKACKNCSCGLAEELENESKPKESATIKSSCGNCYLGDAFRCASCPYLGMPAFKPGEKIELSAQQLLADK